MSDYTRTPNLALYKPTPNSDDDSWGGHLNANADVLDALLGSGGAATGPWLPLSGGTVAGAITASSFATPGNTQTLTAAQSVTRVANFGVNLAGISTYSGNSYKATIGASGDSLAAPHMSSFDLGLLTNLNAGWQGSRGSLWAYLVTAGNTDLTSSVAAGAGAIVSINGAVASNHNMGGVAAGYGSTQFGLGSQWGSVLQTIMYGGSTYWNSSVGLEIDNAILSGANVIWNIGLLLNCYPNSRVQGSQIDAAMVVAADGPTKWRNGILIGSSANHAIDPNGYFLRGISGRDSSAVGTAAGGVDMLQPSFTGVGTGGGGFAFRSANYQVLNSGFVQCGFGQLSFNYAAGNFYIDAPYQQVTGATVATGGANYSMHDILEGTDGSLVSVASVGAGGAVTGVALMRTGWALPGSLPTNPVVFTAQGRAGAAVGSGCTLNLNWVGISTISVNASGGATVFGGTVYATGGINFSGGGAAASNPGSIHADSNWGCMIRGLNGGVADVALQAYDGSVPLRVRSNSLGFCGTNPVAKPTGYTAPTGTATRATFATGSVTLPALAEHVKALIDDLTAYGLIGP